MKQSKKVINTEYKIKKALVELMKEKPIDKMKITELTQKADISRETFYLHYKDVESVYNAIETNVNDQLAEALKGYTGDINRDILLKLFSIISEDEFCRIILTKTKYALKLLLSFRKTLCVSFLYYFPREIRSNLKLMIEFEVQGSLYLLLDWLRTDEPKQTLAKLAIMAETLINDGFNKAYENCSD